MWIGVLQEPSNNSRQSNCRIFSQQGQGVVIENFNPQNRVARSIDGIFGVVDKVYAGMHSAVELGLEK